MTLYANLITSDGREETKHVFHQGVSRVVCRFSITGAQNPQFVNLAADFKSKALLFMCKTCIQTVKDSAQNEPKVAILDAKSSQAPPQWGGGHPLGASIRAPLIKISGSALKSL